MTKGKSNVSPAGHVRKYEGRKYFTNITNRTVMQQNLTSISKTWRVRWSRYLRCRSTAARLLGLRVRIPPGQCCLVCCDFVFCKVEVSATSTSLVQRDPIKRGVSEYDHEASTVRRTRPTRGCGAMKRKSDMTK